MLIISLTPFVAFSIQTDIQHPETIEEAQKLGEGISKMIPGFIREGLQDAIPIWTNIFYTLKRPWDRYIAPLFINIWEKINRPFKNYVESKREVLDEELKREKEEIRESAKQVSKSVWQRILEGLRIEK